MTPAELEQQIKGLLLELDEIKRDLWEIKCPSKFNIGDKVIDNLIIDKHIKPPHLQTTLPVNYTRDDLRRTLYRYEYVVFNTKTNFQETTSEEVLLKLLHQ